MIIANFVLAVAAVALKRQVDEWLNQPFMLVENPNYIKSTLISCIEICWKLIQVSRCLSEPSCCGLRRPEGSHQGNLTRWRLSYDRF